MEKSRRRAPAVGLPLAPLAAVAVYLLIPAATAEGGGLAHEGRVVAAVGVAMAILWLTEALPVAATALLPLATVPLLTAGEVAIREVAAPYAHELIFLYLGGFLLALAMQRWGLHRRIALNIILALGDRPDRVVLGFMLASAFLSMWISNTATAVMMLPIALSVVELVRSRLGVSGAEGDRESSPFAVSLLLGVAYAASIGGVATLIGTPPNLLLAAFVEDNYAFDLSFARWLPLGLTVVVVLLPTAWLLLTRWIYPSEIERISGGQSVLREERRRLGSMTYGERVVSVVFAGTAALWISRGWLVDWQTAAGARPFSGLTDPGIAIVAALVLFAWPVDLRERQFVLHWRQARMLPWGILLLFGGGLSLAHCLRSTGVDRFIGESLAALEGVPVWLLVSVVTVVVILLTEMTSNTATTATFLPVLAASAEGLGVEPMRLLVPMTLAASCAFMMPVATPPNAVVFGSGELTIPQMCRAGAWLNLASAIVIVAVSLLLGY